MNTKALFVVLMTSSILVQQASTAATTPPTFGIRELGRWPGYNRGNISAIEVAGEYAFVAAGAGLQVIHQLDSGNPRRIAALDFESPTKDMAISSDILYVVTSQWDRVFEGNAIFSGIVASSQLEVVDIREPGSPKRIGTYRPIEGILYSVQVAENRVYLSVYDGETEDATLQILNVEDPERPILLGEYETHFALPDHIGKQNLPPYLDWVITHPLSVSGSCVYWGGVGPGLEVIDVSNPAKPMLAGTYSKSGKRVVPAVAPGKRLILGNGADSRDEIEILDVSDPAKIVQISTFATELGGGLAKIVISETEAFLSHDREFVSRYIEIVDISDPTKPRSVGTYAPFGPEYSAEFSISNHHAFVGENGEVAVIDLSDSTHPTETDRFKIGGEITTAAMLGDRVLVTELNRVGNRSYPAFLVLDVDDPSSVKEIDRYENPDWEIANVSGNAVALAYDRGSPPSFDADDPINLVPFYEFPDIQGTVVFSESYAFVSGGSDITMPIPNGSQVVGTRGYLVVLDIRNPPNVEIIGRLETSTRLSSDISVFDDRIYVQGWAYISPGYDYRFVIIDVSDPTQPTLVGDYSDVADKEDGVAVSGGFAFLASADALEIRDVSSPRYWPRLVGRYPFQDTGQIGQIGQIGRSRVVLSGQTAYVLVAGEGLHVVDVSNPREPRGVAFYENAGFAHDIAIAGDRIYLADGGAGLVILELNLPPQLRVTGLNPFRFSISGTQGATVTIQRSTNLRDWEDWQAFIVGETPEELTDPEAAAADALFYRAVTP